MAGSVSLGFRLVTNEDINVGEDLVNLRLEELRDERSGKVHSERLKVPTTSESAEGSNTRSIMEGLAYLLGFRSSFSKNESTFETVSEEETSEVVALGVPDECLDLGLLEVRRRESFGGTEGSAEGSEEQGREDQLHLIQKMNL